MKGTDIRILCFREVEDKYEDTVLAVKDEKTFKTEEYKQELEETLPDIVGLDYEDLDEGTYITREEWNEFIKKLTCGLDATWLDYDFFYMTIPMF